MNRVSFQTVHLSFRGQVHTTTWETTWEFIRWRMQAGRVQALPHGQRELAYLAVGVYVALGGGTEAPQLPRGNQEQSH